MSMGECSITQREKRSYLVGFCLVKGNACMGGFSCEHRAFVFWEQRELNQHRLVMDKLSIKLC